ncbi:uncharacterized protein ACHE_40343S [Aspergillus chevalieri]|uniref:Uncharacterized protein n=1 Tax=Aspergillus chevalieri TaxID=182096 RepID=A0A7R7VNE3_ASPCH|nr:uncharacterized protein ACHE_40343S [Aspergillus chevalieri]BCR87779.1 hypothetical protein ACHE_40343S [Aspergillus chevalieri]
MLQSKAGQDEDLGLLPPDWEQMITLKDRPHNLDRNDKATTTCMNHRAVMSIASGLRACFLEATDRNFNTKTESVVCVEASKAEPEKNSQWKLNVCEHNPTNESEHTESCDEKENEVDDEKEVEKRNDGKEEGGEDKENEESGESEEHGDEISKHDIKAFIYLTKASLQRRRLFITKGGWTGLSSEDTRQGDVVTILVGGDMPFIVRGDDQEMSDVSKGKQRDGTRVALNS